MFEGRHPGTTHLLQFFSFNHLSGNPQTISQACTYLAHEMVSNLSDGPELSAGLRKLLEAKDCFVRAAVVKEADDEVR